MLATFNSKFIILFAIFNYISCIKNPASVGGEVRANSVNEMTRPLCSEAWAKLIPKNQHQYSYNVEAKKTENGNEGYASYYEKLQRTKCLKEWTILVYMAANNDLAPYALSDLYEMEAGYSGETRAAGSTLKTDLLVNINLAGTPGSRRLHLFQTPKAYVDYTGMESLPVKSIGDIASPIVSQDKNVTSDGRAAFESFIEWGVQAYPAQHYMVVVWGHGQGWTAISAKGVEPTGRSLSKKDFADVTSLAPASVVLKTGKVDNSSDVFAGRAFGGLAFDDSTSTYLDVPSVAQILEKTSQKYLNGKPFDVYASDACLMQMVEVGYEMTRAARFVVGSANIQNYFGLPYRRFLYELNTGSFFGKKKATGISDEAQLISLMLPELERAGLNRGGLTAKSAPDAIKTLTMSSLSSAALAQQMAPAMTRFAIAAKSFFDEDIFRASDFALMAQQSPYFMGSSLSLSYFVAYTRLLLDRERERLGKTTDSIDALENAAMGLDDAVKESLMAYVIGTDYIVPQNAHYLSGLRSLSFWLPASKEDFLARRDDFLRSRLYQAIGKNASGENHWVAWLKTLYDF